MRERSMPNKKKEEVITFKVNKNLAKVIKSIPNRSEFIRNAISAAFNETCPLCNGEGYLAPNQSKHWEKFKKKHKMVYCNDCKTEHMECL